MIKKFCELCNSSFLTINSRKNYCSKSCKQKNSYKKNKFERLKRLKINYGKLKTSGSQIYLDKLKKNRIRNKNYYKNNIEFRNNQIKKTQDRRKKFPAQCSEVRRMYYLKVEKLKNINPKNRIKRQNKWRKRYYSDPIFRAKEFIKSRLKRVLKQKNIYKPVEFEKAFGTDFYNFKTYIENQFKDGMTWSNHGKWHLDHIIPLSSFDLSNEIEFKKANNYLNFQPLWAEENLKKSNKLIYERRSHV